MPTIKSNHSPLFWRGVGGEAVCFILVYVSILSSKAHRAIRSIRDIRVLLNAQAAEPS